MRIFQEDMCHFYFASDFRLSLIVILFHFRSRLDKLSGKGKVVMVKDFSALHEVSEKIAGMICGEVKVKYIKSKGKGKGKLNSIF